MSSLLQKVRDFVQPTDRCRYKGVLFVSLLQQLATSGCELYLEEGTHRPSSRNLMSNRHPAKLFEIWEWIRKAVDSDPTPVQMELFEEKVIEPNDGNFPLITKEQHRIAEALCEGLSTEQKLLVQFLFANPSFFLDNDYRWEEHKVTFDGSSTKFREKSAIAIHGPAKVGKTYVYRNILQMDTNGRVRYVEDKDSRASGIGWNSSDSYVVLDHIGSTSAMMSCDKLRVQDKITTAHIIRSIMKEAADCHVVVVNKITSSDQSFIEELSKMKKEGLGAIFVIYNFMYSASGHREGEERTKDERKETFQSLCKGHIADQLGKDELGMLEAGLPSCPKISGFVDTMNGRREIYHIPLHNGDNADGRQYNSHVFSFIRSKFPIGNRDLFRKGVLNELLHSLQESIRSIVRKDLDLALRALPGDRDAVSPTPKDYFTMMRHEYERQLGTPRTFEDFSAMEEPSGELPEMPPTQFWLMPTKKCEIQVLANIARMNLSSDVNTMVPYTLFRMQGTQNRRGARGTEGYFMLLDVPEFHANDGAESEVVNADNEGVVYHLLRGNGCSLSFTVEETGATNGLNITWRVSTNLSVGFANGDELEFQAYPDYFGVGDYESIYDAQPRNSRNEPRLQYASRKHAEETKEHTHFVGLDQSNMSRVLRNGQMKAMPFPNGCFTNMSLSSREENVRAVYLGNGMIQISFRPTA